MKKIEAIGYHIDCGLPIYPNDYLRNDDIPLNQLKPSLKIYKCWKCHKEITEKDLIPF